MVFKHLRLVALLAIAMCALVAIPVFAAYLGAAKVLPATVEIVEPAGPGDVNGDGIISVLDLTKVVRVILLLDIETPGADANQDGIVSVLDLTKIVRLILRLN